MLRIVVIFSNFSFCLSCMIVTNRLAFSYFSSYFTPVVDMHHYDTHAASHGDLFLQRKNTFIYGIRSIQYSWARLWNTLPAPIRDSQSFSVFRLQVKALFFSHCMEDWCLYSIELIMPPAGNWLSGLLISCTGAGCWGGVSVVGKLAFLLWMACFALVSWAW